MPNVVPLIFPFQLADFCDVGDAIEPLLCTRPRRQRPLSLPVSAGTAPLYLASPCVEFRRLLNALAPPSGICSVIYSSTDQRRAAIDSSTYSLCIAVAA